MAAPSGTSWGATNSNGTSQDCIGVYVSTSSTATTVTANMQVWYWSKYGIKDSNNNFYMAWDGNSWTNLGAKTINHSVSTGAGWSTSNQTLIYSGSKTYTKGTSAYTGRAWGQKSGIDKIPGTASHSVAFSIPAKASYKITYNANGGTGAPGAQTKWYGTNLTLSSAKPTRTGYTFQGWATSSTSSTVSYKPGATYTGNAALNLYAVWKANTFAVKYDANGGTGASADQTKTYGVDLKLSSTKPTKTNYNFLGWGTSAASTTVAYAAGATYKSDAVITLYAIWELAYLAPRITDYTVDRCDSSGTLSEEGTYAIATFKWATDKTVTGIKIEYKAELDTVWTEITETATGTNGSVSKIIGSALSTEFAYDIRITVTDSLGSSSNTKTIAPMTFAIDFLNGGRGVAFGKPASLEGVVDIGFKSRFTGGIDAIEIEADTDLNSITTPGYYVCRGNATAATLLNSPTVKAFSLEVYSHAGTHQRLTIYHNYDVHTYVRNYYSNVWGEWQSVINTELIEATTDLNNVIIPGVYYSLGGNPNTPSLIYDSSFTLEVYPAGTVNQLVQRITRCFKEQITVFTRVFYQDGWGRWSPSSNARYSKYLWSGGSFMHQNQSITLSEKISDQVNGIVLIFSAYRGGKVSNSEFTSHFMPKEAANVYPGTGHGFITSASGVEGVKYLYFRDTTITGHALNDDSSYNPSGSVVYKNNEFVLRYVIGV